jgi:hypothetical protein
MQTTVQINNVSTRAQHQVKGVTETDVRAETFQLFGRHGLHGPVCPHRHEGGCLDDPMSKSEPTETSRTVGCEDLELGSHESARVG